MAGKLIVLFAANGTNQHWSYDPAGRAICATSSIQGATLCNQAATPDESDQRTTLADIWGHTTFGYDLAATMYLRQLERHGLAPATIQGWLAAARCLVASLRWCRAFTSDPFLGCHAPRDATPAWDKRMPYGDDEVAALLQAATDDADRVQVLLGAHAGLRAQECTDLRWTDVHLARHDLLVRCGKGGKQRVVALSAALRQALQVLARREDGYVLNCRTPGSAWRHMQALCDQAKVTAKGMHALRHVRWSAAQRGARATGGEPLPILMRDSAPGCDVAVEREPLLALGAHIVRGFRPENGRGLPVLRHARSDAACHLDF